MNTSIPFTYHSPAAGEGTRWIRLQQEDDALEAVTVAEAAQAIDNVFGLTPCHDASANDSGRGSDDDDEAPPRDRFAAVMAALMTAELCSQPDYWTAHVLVLRSHADPAYVLRGEAETGPVTIAATERITRTQREEIDLSSASADLSWPYAGNLTTTAPDTVTLTVRGSTVYASRPCGRIVVRYRTSYDRVSVRVPVDATGSQRDDGTVERPTLESAVLIAFWGDQATELALSPPAQDEDEDQAQIDHYCAGRAGGGGGSSSGDCWRIRRARYLCNCSKSEVGDPVESRVAAPCPKGVSSGAYLGTEDAVAGYVTCPGDEDEINDPEFYEKTCCEPPTGPLPRCKRTYSIYRGGAQISGGADRYQRLYGANVRLTAVSPEGGICGDEIREWDTGNKDCCGDIVPLSPHPDNPTEFKAGESHFVEVLDGRPGELIWTARGGLYFTVHGHKVYTLRTSARKVAVTAPAEGTCPEPSVKVDDGCKPVEMSFVGGGAAPLELPYDDLVVAPGQRFTVQATGGVPPMRWQVGGQIEIISWDQTTGSSVLLEASPDFCGKEDITVIDVCGDDATAPVRSTEGRWKSVANFDPYSAPWSGSPNARQSAGNLYAVDSYRGYKANLTYNQRAVNFTTPDSPTSVPHAGSCEEAMQRVAPSVPYTGNVIARIEGASPIPCEPKDEVRGSIETGGEVHDIVTCNGMCVNYHKYVIQRNRQYETNNLWTVQWQQISALWEWVCPGET